MRPRPTIRLRLTALYALLVFLAGGLLLAVSYALLDGHLHDTLRDRDADAVLRDLRGQYVLALLAITVMAVLLGWLIAGRALSRLRAIEAAAAAGSRSTGPTTSSASSRTASTRCWSAWTPPSRARSASSRTPRTSSAPL
jgi:hypothetical protein